MAKPMIVAGLIPVQYTQQEEDGGGFAAGTLVRQENTLMFDPAPALKDLYLFGATSRVSSRLGLWLFFATMAGVGSHGLLRYAVWRRKRSGKTRNPAGRVMVYSPHKRFSHWMLALGMIAMILSGIKIHFANFMPLVSYEAGVFIHNLTAFLLLMHVAVSFLFHFFSGDYRQFLPNLKRLPRDVLAQARYYAYGIFTGESNPFKKSPTQRMNPMQQMAYLGVLLVLLPVQGITGLLIYFTGHYPELTNRMGGLVYLAPLHDLISWLIISFLVMHLYLITTGTQVSSHLKAMVTGYEEEH